MAPSRTALIVLALLVSAAPAQSRELKVATWAIAWLTDRPAGDPALPPDVGPKSDEDAAALRGYAEQLDADVVALQEVDGARNAARVFPPDRYDVVMTQDGQALGVGFAIRKGLTYTVNPDLAALDVTPGARFRLRAGADVTLATPSGPLRLLAVHLKAGCRDDPLGGDRPQCATLSSQLAVLRDWVAQREAEGAAFVIAGGFNRRMDGGDAFLATLAQAGPLARADEGRSDPCWGGGAFTDHLLAGGPARLWLQPDSMRVLVYRERGVEWRKRLSDHCPLSARLLLPDGADGR
jgi:endonuclease/exonuclease/phosphatase family metal-dependent hydrolase